jgi:hypothetical protein
MIKFFRHIRKKLIGENRFSKYLLYAIGEIILVVIGILIALYVNEWNQKRLLKHEEQKSLKFLHAEFEGNLQKFDYKYNLQKVRKNAIHKILFEDLSDTQISDLDSLYKMSFYSWTFVPSFSTYNSLVSTGKLNLFSEDSLKIRLSGFKDMVVDFQDEEVNLWHHSRDHLIPHEMYSSEILSETKFNLRSRTKDEEIADKEIYLAQFQDSEYRNRLTVTLLYLDLIFNEGEVLRNEMVELIEMINEELD